ncbi:MAG TPA: response regulator [Gemmatimonadaceae bacterium]|jgi:CheY-like chemotaxis protein|nr:response regulator [Gemmatimonadaceae bacterium]
MRRRPIVVLAEDNEDTRRVYGLILRHFGYQVEEAANGLEAVQVVRDARPSLVLMDIGLPGLDGWEASRALKADPRTAHIPLIAFSARIDSTADLGRGASFDGYVLKPIAPRELVRRVDAYLRLLSIDVPRLTRGATAEELDETERPAEILERSSRVIYFRR